MKNSAKIYLDFAAATPLDPRVLKAMQPFFAEDFFNPSAQYLSAQKMRAELENSRVKLASCLGAKPAEIIFTAGATESVNLAIQGIMRAWPEGNVAVGASEHKAVLECAKNFNHKIIEVDKFARVNLDNLKNNIDDKTVLVSIGLVNSELGSLQPIKKFAEVIKNIKAQRKSRGVKMPLYLHTDASQAAGHVDLQISRLGVDLMTLGANKIYGPKQTGLLYVNKNVELKPLIFGGGQERGLRSGTENVAGAVGLAWAMELVSNERVKHAKYIKNLSETFKNSVKKELSEVTFHTPEKNSALHILNFSISGIDAERLLYMLDERGVMVSTGAACGANQRSGSHVLKAIGLSESEIQSSLRVSFGYLLNEDDVKKAAQILIKTASEIKKFNQ